MECTELLGEGEDISAPLTPILCRIGLSWFHPHALLYFRLRAEGSAGEGACVPAPDSLWLREAGCAQEGWPVQLALPFFLARERRGAEWGSSEKSQGLLLGWPLGSCGLFSLASTVKGHFTLFRLSVNLLCSLRGVD